MQKLFAVLLFVVAGFNLNAQNVVHDANAQVRNVSSFSKIRVSSAISLYLSQGNTQGVAVSAEDADAISKIRTEVNNGVLKIYVENGVWNGWNWSNKHLKAYVTFTTLEMLDVSGASNVELTDPINVGDFNLELSGASNMKGVIKGSDLNFNVHGASNAKIDVTGTSLELSQSGASNFKGQINTPKASFDLSGASTIDIDGTAADLVIDASGASNFKGGDLQAENCKIEATGASSASITVSKAIDATASGASSIHYSGGASITNIDVSGGSSVKKKS
jgi:Putative auto-transporter adhesin, head GIN domain